MKAYIMKYALTEGVFVVDGEDVATSSLSMFRWKLPDSVLIQSAFGNEWHRMPESALADAESRRIRKIASHKRSIAKLEKLTFLIPEEG